MHHIKRAPYRTELTHHTSVINSALQIAASEDSQQHFLLNKTIFQSGLHNDRLILIRHFIVNFISHSKSGINTYTALTGRLPAVHVK